MINNNLNYTTKLFKYIHKYHYYVHKLLLTFYIHYSSILWPFARRKPCSDKKLKN